MPNYILPFKVLDAEQDLIDDSLELEKKQLNMEREWEILRLKREKEAEEEMKEQIKINEDALLDKLQRLGEEKENKDVENEKLREQLKVCTAKYLLFLNPKIGIYFAQFV